MGYWPFRVDGKGNVEQCIQRCPRLEGVWKPLVGSKDNYGYRLASWTDETGLRRFKRVHCVVWETYNGPVPDGREIDHIDMDKANNNIANLRVVTHRENLLAARAILGNWGHTGKLKPWQIELVLALPVGWRCLRPLAKRWNVSKFTLGNVRAQAKATCNHLYLACL